jgi:hypothetical protein
MITPAKGEVTLEQAKNALMYFEKHPIDTTKKTMFGVPIETEIQPAINKFKEIIKDSPAQSDAPPVVTDTPAPAASVSPPPAAAVVEPEVIELIPEPSNGKTKSKTAPTPANPKKHSKRHKPNAKN